jgi:hypothetical protein
MDGSSNPPLPLFFANALGMPTKNLTADAYATIFNGPIIGVNGNGSAIPLALDQNVWNAYLAYLNAGSPSNTATTISVNPASGADALNITYNLNVTADANGFQQLDIFNGAKTIGTAGRGWLSLNDSNIDDSSLKTWAQNGLSKSDLSALTTSVNAGTGANDVLMPLPSSGNGDGTSTHQMNSWDWQADSGNKPNIQPFLTTNVPLLLPIFQPVVPNTDNTYLPGTKNPSTGYSNALIAGGSTGSNEYLNIVGFVGIVITSTSNSTYIEPTAVVPPGGIFGTLVPADSNAASFYSTFSIPRLTRPGG